MWILIESESDIEIFQMYGIDGAGPAPSLYIPSTPCLVIHTLYMCTLAKVNTHSVEYLTNLTRLYLHTLAKKLCIVTVYICTHPL